MNSISDNCFYVINVNPEEIPSSMAFHLSLHCLSRYQYTKKSANYTFELQGMQSKIEIKIKPNCFRSHTTSKQM